MSSIFSTGVAVWVLVFLVPLIFTPLPPSLAANRQVEPEVAPISTPVTSTPVFEPVPLQVLVAAQRQFGFDLMGQLVAADPQVNWVFSPLSVALALQMAQSGAAGSTFETMRQVFHLPPLNAETLAASHGHLLAVLNQDLGDGIQLTMANSLWVRQGIPLESSFLQRSLEAFDADVNQLDFRSDTAPDQINGWVAQQTQGQIDQLVAEIDPDTLLVLINAIYFKGSWAQAFDPALTSEQPFTRQDGSQVTVPLMQMESRLAYSNGDLAQWVSLPYGDNPDLSFVLGLPQPGIPLEQVLDSLSDPAWQQILEQMRPRRGMVALPRLQLTSSANLVPPLVNLGLEVAFGEQADFSGIASIPTRISEVIHKAVLTVDEVGSEAAAATSVGVVTRSAPIEDPFVVRSDRPFVAVIQDHRTGAILFVAVVQDPSRES